MLVLDILNMSDYASIKESNDATSVYTIQLLKEILLLRKLKLTNKMLIN